jgi:hypothetical protein
MLASSRCPDSNLGEYASHLAGLGTRGTSRALRTLIRCFRSTSLLKRSPFDFVALVSRPDLELLVIGLCCPFRRDQGTARTRGEQGDSGRDCDHGFPHLVPDGLTPHQIGRNF